MKSFKKGDRVIGIGYVDGRDIDGLEGTVHYVYVGSETLSIKFDKNIGGHSGGHYWNCQTSAVKHISTNIWKGKRR